MFIIWFNIDTIIRKTYLHHLYHKKIPKHRSLNISILPYSSFIYEIQQTSFLVNLFQPLCETICVKLLGYLKKVSNSGRCGNTWQNIFKFGEVVLNFV